MTTIDYTGIADWLEQEVDSHEVYASTLLDKLEDFGLTVAPHLDQSYVMVSLPDGQTTHVGVQTDKQVAASIKARGLGGWVNETDDKLFTGYLLSMKLCGLLTGDDSTRYQGRGTMHRDYIDRIRKHVEPSAADKMRAAMEAGRRDA